MLLLLIALGGALVFSDSVAELARYSAEYQRRINQVLSTSLRDVQSGTGSLALCGPSSPSASAMASCTRWGRATARPSSWPTSSTARSPARLDRGHLRRGLDRLHPHAGGASAGGCAKALLHASACWARCARCATSRSSPMSSSFWSASGACGQGSRAGCMSTDHGDHDHDMARHMTTHHARPSP